ncbi:GntR family transcriptional regulator [Bordetella hinzii]|uniref:FCD domain protein n=2 Tax=Bordetella hinzii TaxID=103855 RepID=A0ABR4R4G5_9BORD|nr:GntR family transcriptional regulator [Bordetella hinzii]KCB44427.1 FCD domain protein [Bordetella hinzii 5132]AKQ55748.1 putative HTH-type transcriptional regulator YdfH [Bordetella hinzii]KCB24662.1 FCD domain protein [Bordetella hinzii L60]KCB25292.1 FCD domain protein [Bordetella hinzii OH87 BAL007II]QDJ43261.1 GntR family transcriptional regulator [Bordetella hinzii]
MSSIIKQSLADKKQAMSHCIRDQLRHEILTGVLPAGTPLKQDSLATRFQSSRIPVREALRQLETEGLVVYYLNRGAVVMKMDIDQICELLDVRIALECYALRLAVPNMAETDFEEMENILAAYDAADAVEEWADLNRRFHLALCTPANNPRLRRLIEEYGLTTDRYTHEMMSRATGKSKPQQDHYAILQACRQQDAWRAAHLLEAHILETRKNLMAMQRKAENPR